MGIVKKSNVWTDIERTTEGIMKYRDTGKEELMRKFYGAGLVDNGDPPREQISVPQSIEEKHAKVSKSWQAIRSKQLELTDSDLATKFEAAASKAADEIFSYATSRSALAKAFEMEQASRNPCGEIEPSREAPKFIQRIQRDVEQSKGPHYFMVATQAGGSIRFSGEVEKLVDRIGPAGIEKLVHSRFSGVDCKYAEMLIDEPSSSAMRVTAICGGLDARKYDPEKAFAKCGGRTKNCQAGSGRWNHHSVKPRIPSAESMVSAQRHPYED